jgi:hypothetical protein
MLTIRAEQMTSLERCTLTAFEEDMLAHLREFAPLHCKVIGESGVRDTIRLGIERAKRYGLSNRGPVRFYIELMFMLGSHFDTDPQMCWAAWILQGTWIADQMERAERLREQTAHYLEQVAGVDNAYAVGAFRRLQHLSASAFPDPTADLEFQLMSGMKWVYPEKCAYLGDPPLLAVIDRGIRTAAGLGIAKPRGIALCVALAFAMGHGFADDPLFPWVAKTLSEPGIADPNMRAERLRAKATTYLERALGNLAKR